MSELPVTVKVTSVLRVTEVQEVDIYAVPCPRCEHSGMVGKFATRGGMVECPTCRGKGRVWVEK